MVFKFLDPEVLKDDELELRLSKTIPADEEKGYVPAYNFDMINSDSKEKMGEIRIRIGENKALYYAGNVGYNVKEKFRGHRYAARSCKLLFPLFKKHGLKNIIITCDEDNLASRKTCELAGDEFMEVADIPEDHEMYKNGDRKVCIYKFKI